MGLFKWLSGAKEPTPGSAKASSGPSIYQHVKTHLRQDGPGLTEGGETLPDEAKVVAGSQLRFMAGARDGILGHHMNPGEAEKTVQELFDLISAYCKSPRPENQRKLYDRMMQQPAT